MWQKYDFKFSKYDYKHFMEKAWKTQYWGATSVRPVLFSIQIKMLVLSLTKPKCKWIHRIQGGKEFHASVISLSSVFPTISRCWICLASAEKYAWGFHWEARQRPLCGELSYRYTWVPSVENKAEDTWKYLQMCNIRHFRAGLTSLCVIFEPCSENIPISEKKDEVWFIPHSKLHAVI